MATDRDIDDRCTERFHDEPDGRLSEGITRRNALKAGVAMTSGLVLGGCTAGANRQLASDHIHPVDLFVRPEGSASAEPTPPAPTGGDLLVERIAGLPVDDGTDPDTVDGETGQLTWNEFSDIEGRIELKCLEKGTHVSMHLRGLVPHALYTAWVVAFDPGGFDGSTRDIERATRNIVGWAPLGETDGSENAFRPSSSGEAQITAIDEPGPWPNGPASETDRKSKRCLLEEFEVHFVGGYHLDDENQGSRFRPNGVEQFAFVAKDGEFV